MIGSLQGVIELFHAATIVINVHDVGYRVHVPQLILQKYHVGDSLKVFTYTHVREDILELYGFESYEDLQLFEAFLGVSGVGPKTAIGIFTVGTREQILSAIQKADVKFFTGVPRLGTKNAQKLIIELKGKLGSLAELDLNNVNAIAETEVTQALKGFGFSQKEIDEAVKAVSEKTTDTSTKIKLALKYLGK